MQMNVKWRRKGKGTRLSPKINIVIDSKALWSNKGTAQIRMMIDQELYRSNWHWRTADQFGQALDSFKLDLHNSTEEGKNMRGKEKNERPILLDEEESLRMKQKEVRISYSEKVYFTLWWRKIKWIKES